VASQTWGGAEDSYLEYLIKYARLTNNADEIYADTWKTAVDSSIEKLVKTSTVGNWTFMADFDGANIVHVRSHLRSVRLILPLLTRDIGFVPSCVLHGGQLDPRYA
jgi:hypothetical protein